MTTPQIPWAERKAAQRVRRKAETLIGRISGMPRRLRSRVAGWAVVHPAKETGAQRRPVRVGRTTDRRPRRERRAIARLAARTAPPVPVDASTTIPTRVVVARGSLRNPTALRGSR